jgi:hypothetical protein
MGPRRRPRRGLDAVTVAELRADPGLLPPYLDAAERKAALSGPAGDGQGDGEEELDRWPFRLERHGVEKRVDRIDSDTGKTTIEWRWICSHLEVAAETRSAEGDEWGRLLIIRDNDGRSKEWAMPMSMLAGDGTAYRERLLSFGLIMAPGGHARSALHEYISTARTGERARCVGRVGWHARSFVLGGATVEPRHG